MPNVVIVVIGTGMFMVVIASRFIQSVLVLIVLFILFLLLMIVVLLIAIMFLVMVVLVCVHARTIFRNF